MIFRIIRAKILILIRLICHTSVYLYKIKNILPHKQPTPIRRMLFIAILACGIEKRENGRTYKKGVGLFDKQQHRVFVVHSRRGPHNRDSAHPMACRRLKALQESLFRNHKGNRHYLVVLDCERDLHIHDLEQRLHQGKLTFASPRRMAQYLGLCPGSVSPFGLINDSENHVHLFIDENLKKEESLSFHPNDNRATVVISQQEFMRYLSMVGNSYEFIELY